MIRNFRHKGLARFFRTENKAGIQPQHARRLKLILVRLNTARIPEDMNLPGLRLHPLAGAMEGFWSVDVSGNWRVIFKIEENGAVDVDYLDYH